LSFTFQPGNLAEGGKLPVPKAWGLANVFACNLIFYLY